jgi:hypothetical protein
MKVAGCSPDAVWLAWRGQPPQFCFKGCKTTRCYPFQVGAQGFMCGEISSVNRQSFPTLINRPCNFGMETGCRRCKSADPAKKLKSSHRCHSMTELPGFRIFVLY